ncbi:MAG: phenylalanine--tRNA ligase subunit beta [Candidatus Binataceae bacterium]
MKVPLSWLSEFVNPEADVDEICRRLTLAGVEVENLEWVRPGFSEVVVARVLGVERHPNADRLSLCDVDAGAAGRFRVVCGAPNVKSGMTAAYAKIGARLMAGVHGQGGAESVETAPPLEAAVIRGIRSEGMLCSERELGLSADHEGILELDSGDPGDKLAAVMGLDDAVLEVAITPNRGDCLSILGLAREIAALFEVKLKAPNIRPPKLADGAEILPIEVTIEAPDLCPRYAALAMHAVTIRRSPIHVRRRLELCGMRAVNNVVDATNYVMLELGQPLHAFDYGKIAGARIIVRRAGADREMVTLDELRRDLLPDDLVIADAEKPKALAGVMGGQGSAVSETTKSLLLESAYFEAAAVARTGRRLGLRSEASYRFERGIDRQQQPRALYRVAEIIKMAAPGSEAGAFVDIDAKPAIRREINFEPSAIGSLLGVNIPLPEMEKRLKALGVTIASGGGKKLIATVPPFRPDLNETADLAEEIARLKGLAEIPESLPERPAALTPAQDPSRVFAGASREVMLGCGLTEIKTIAFAGPEENAKFPGVAAGEPIRVGNPLSAELSELRRSLIPGLLTALRFNLNREAKAFHGFEIGRVFSANDGAARESDSLAGLSYGEYALEAVGRASIAADFFTLKGIVEAYFQSFGQPIDAKFAPDAALEFLHPGRSARIIVDGKNAGYLGELHPRDAMRLELDTGCEIFELDLSLLVSYGPTLRSLVEAPPRFPAVRRDLALVVDRGVPAGHVMRTIEELGSALLERVKLFDVYEGESLQPGKKSVGLQCFYRARDRTLTDAEVNRAHADVIERARMRLGAELRQ